MCWVVHPGLCVSGCVRYSGDVARWPVVTDIQEMGRQRQEHGESLFVESNTRAVTLWFFMNPFIRLIEIHLLQATDFNIEASHITSVCLWCTQCISQHMGPIFIVDTCIWKVMCIPSPVMHKSVFYEADSDMRVGQTFEVARYFKNRGVWSLWFLDHVASCIFLFY